MIHLLTLTAVNVHRFPLPCLLKMLLISFKRYAICVTYNISHLSQRFTNANHKLVFTHFADFFLYHNFQCFGGTDRRTCMPLGQQGSDALAKPPLRSDKDMSRKAQGNCGEVYCLLFIIYCLSSCKLWWEGGADQMVSTVDQSSWLPTLSVLAVWMRRNGFSITCLHNY